MPKVSVIIPIYGVEKYIERCARSLFEQTLDDIEYIFVDDCTKDNSIAVLKRVIEDYPNRKSQIKILHHDVNKGLPQARKTGIMAANGEYIAHCDSDDWVDKDFYMKMYEKAKEEKADLVVGDFYRTDGMDYNKKCIGAHTTNIECFIDNLFFQKDPWCVWNKLFLRKCYDNIIYPNFSNGEDLAFVFQLLKRCRKMAYQPQTYYYYYYNDKSISKNTNIDNVIRNFLSIRNNIHIVNPLFSGSTKYSTNLKYLNFQSKTLLRTCIKEPEGRKLFHCSFSDFILLFHPKVNYKVKLAYLYCFILKNIHIAY